METQLNEDYFNRLYNRQFQGTNCLNQQKKKKVLEICKKIYVLSQNNPDFFCVEILEEYSRFYSHLHSIIVLTNRRYNIHFLGNMFENFVLDCKNLLIYHLVENYLTELYNICLFDI